MLWRSEEPILASNYADGLPVVLVGGPVCFYRRRQPCWRDERCGKQSQSHVDELDQSNIGTAHQRGLVDRGLAGVECPSGSDATPSVSDIIRRGCTLASLTRPSAANEQANRCFSLSHQQSGPEHPHCLSVLATLLLQSDGVNPAVTLPEYSTNSPFMLAHSSCVSIFADQGLVSSFFPMAASPRPSAHTAALNRPLRVHHHYPSLCTACHSDIRLADWLLTPNI